MAIVSIAVPVDDEEEEELPVEQTVKVPRSVQPSITASPPVEKVIHYVRQWFKGGQTICWLHKNQQVVEQQLAELCLNDEV